MARLWALPSQLLPTIANYRKLSQLFAAPVAPPGRCTRAIARECLLGMQQYVCSRGVPCRSRLVQSLIALARHAWHAPPAAECHTYIQGVRGVNAGCAACKAHAGARAWHRRAGKVARLGALPSQLLPTPANYRKLSQLFAAALAPPGLCTPRHGAGMSLGDAAIRFQPSCAAREQVGAAPYRTGTPCRARPTGARMSYVHAGRQGCQGRLCGVWGSRAGALAWHRRAGKVARLGALQAQL